MSPNLLFCVCFVLVGASLFLPQSEARGIYRRQSKELEVELDQDDTVLLREDLQRVENAIIVELHENNFDPNLVTPEKLDELVEEHSQTLPWYRRLFNKFKEDLPRLITAAAKHVLEGYVIPEVSRQLSTADD